MGLMTPSRLVRGILKHPLFETPRQRFSVGYFLVRISQWFRLFCSRQNYTQYTKIGIISKAVLHNTPNTLPNTIHQICRIGYF